MDIPTDLNFDVPWLLDVLFQEHDLVAKRLHGLAFGRLELGLELGLGHGDPHAFAAAATDGLDHDGEADLGSLRLQCLDRLVLTVVSPVCKSTTNDYFKNVSNGDINPYPTTGTLALDMMIFEVDLIPMSRMAVAGGPTNMTPDFWIAQER